MTGLGRRRWYHIGSLTNNPALSGPTLIDTKPDAGCGELEPSQRR